MNVYDLEAWCRAGNGGVVGRTLLLPLSNPRAWDPGPLPAELMGLGPMPGRALEAAQLVQARTGLRIAVGFALLARRPDEPLAHAFNVTADSAVDLGLAGMEVTGYWGYVPTDEQLTIDAYALAQEAPSPDGRAGRVLWPRR